MKSSSTRNRLTGMLLAGVTIGFLSACSSEPDRTLSQTEPHRPDIRFNVQPEIRTTDRVHIVNAVSDVSTGETDSFFTEFLSNGGGAIHAVHSRNTDPKLLAAVAKRAYKVGLLPDELALHVGEDISVQGVTLTYTAYRAVPIDCPKNVRAYSSNSLNDNHPTFGCSVNRGIATMVANPRDFVTSRPETAPDGVRRTLVIDKYRKGEPTDAERSPYANSGISNVGSN